MALLGLGSILDVFNSPYGSKSKGEWDLTEGAFVIDGTNQRVVFFYDKTTAAARNEGGEDPLKKTAVEQITDKGGRRKVVYEYPYVDGHKVKDLGRKGEDFSFTIYFFGPNYQQLFNTFISVVVNNKASGVLTHPVRGQIHAAFFDYEFNHNHDKTNCVSIHAQWKEDTGPQISKINTVASSQNSALRSALQTIASTEFAISSAIASVASAKGTANLLITGMTSSLAAIVGSCSKLLGGLASTFSSDSQLQNLSGQANASGIPITGVSAGTVNGEPIPAVFSVGLDANGQDLLNSQTDAFVNQSQITPQQAVFQANQIRASISDAITEAENNFGNDSYDIVLNYRTLAVQIQDTTESCIASANTNIKKYTVPYPMSLRKVAFLNGLDKDRSGDISDLNPDLPSVNWVDKDTVLTVPAS